MTFLYRFWFVFWGIFLLIFGCKNPFYPSMRENPNYDVTLNNSPIALLQTLEQSYRQKNLTMFKSCLAPDFRFELIQSEVNLIGIDVNGDGIKDDWWGYDQEVEYHTNLFIEGSSDGSLLPPDQIFLRLQIPPTNQWENDPQVGHEEWLIIPCLFDLQLVYTFNNSSITSNGVARFYVKPVHGRWYIAIWRDESNI